MHDIEHLTDEQIEEKISKCYQYIGPQIDLGHHSLADSIRTTLEQLELERALRLQQKQHELHLKELDKHHMKINDPLNVGEIDLPDIPSEEE